MAIFNIETAQNVEISKKIPCEKPLLEQLEIMERYTSVHKARLGSSKEMREAACLEVLYPTLFRHIQDQDLIAGRLDFLPIGFGCVTSLGGVGHYCGVLISFLPGLMAIDLVPRQASGAAIGITGIASYAAAGIQNVVTGLLLDNHITDAGVHDYTYASWFWLGAAVISFLLPILI